MPAGGWKLGDRVRVRLDRDRSWDDHQVSSIDNATGTIEKMPTAGNSMYRVRFDGLVIPWWTSLPIEALWFDGDELEAVPPPATLAVRVHLRAPRAGERGWWVEDISSPLAALREVFVECDTITLREEGVGWLADEDHTWAPDECGMYPVTLEVLA